MDQDLRRKRRRLELELHRRGNLQGGEEEDRALLEIQQTGRERLQKPDQRSGCRKGET